MFVYLFYKHEGDIALNEFTLEIIIILLLIAANGIFAMSEIAVVAARKIRLQQLADTGNKQAQAALKLAKSPNQFLATVQVGITLVGILAGAFGGATISKKISAYLNTLPVLAQYNQLIGVGIVVIVITYLSLIIGELVPKRLALNNPEKIASKIALPMNLLSKIALPVVRLLDTSTNIVFRLLGIKASLEPAVTVEEIKGLIEQGTESGIFEETEQSMIENVLRLDERPVGAWMTPRTKIVWLEIDEPLEEIRHKVVEYHYSRFPVAKNDLDHIIGVVRAKDLLVQSLTQQTLDLKGLLRPPLFIPDSMSALDVLELFKKQRTHIALITDEYGGIEGMITHNDILIYIGGNIPLAGESSAEPQVHQREDGSWLVDGLLDIETLKEMFNIEQLSDEEDGGYHTVGGFVMNQVHNIPVTGQYFEWRDLRFEVMDMDGRRVDKVLITPLTETKQCKE
jgi:putative hemolysin